MTGSARIVRGDALALPLDDSTVDLIVTSPPYQLDSDLYPHPVQFLCPDEASLKPLGHLTGASGTMPTRRPDRQIRF